MTEHLPECLDKDECEYDANGKCWVKHHPCICDRLRACEERVINAAINAVREAIGKEWHDEFVPKDEYDCCGCSSYDGIVNDATVAIDALREVEK